MKLYFLVEDNISENAFVIKNHHAVSDIPYEVRNEEGIVVLELNSDKEIIFVEPDLDYNEYEEAIMELLWKNINFKISPDIKEDDFFFDIINDLLEDGKIYKIRSGRYKTGSIPPKHKLSNYPIEDQIKYLNKGTLGVDKDDILNNLNRYLHQFVTGKVKNRYPKIMSIAFNFYRRYLRGNRWPEFEDAIFRRLKGYGLGKSDGVFYKLPYIYMSYLNDRWLKGEQIFIDSKVDHLFNSDYNRTSYIFTTFFSVISYIIKYYKNINLENEINDLLSKTENRIKDENDVYTIYYYAKDVVGERWLEGEKKLLESGDAGIIHWYARDVVGDRWPEGEEKLLKLGNAKSIYEYARDVMDGKRWPEGEARLLELGDVYNIYEYVKDVMNGERWPEAEPILKKSVTIWNKYKDYVGIDSE